MLHELSVGVRDLIVRLGFVLVHSFPFSKHQGAAAFTTRCGRGSSLHVLVFKSVVAVSFVRPFPEYKPPGAAPE